MIERENQVKGEPMQVITSKENAVIKHIEKLKEKKYRNEYQEYIIEGAKLVKEAMEENANIKYLIVKENAESNHLVQKYLKEELQTREFIQVSNQIFNLLSEVEKPQGILAVISKNRKDKEVDYSQDIILALDGIQDPGNLGTIIRTADSIGLTQILISKGTADPYNAKVIRSTMGAIFRVNIIECANLAQQLKECKENYYQLIVTDLNATQSIYDISLKGKVIIIGNEANGVSKEILELADIRGILPMMGKTESLNASVATGIILYEYVRQKLKNG